MNADNADSFELGPAARLLQALCGRGVSPGAVDTDPPISVSYARLAAVAPLRPRPTPPPAETARPLPAAAPEPTLQRLADWDGWLAWCVTLTRAEAAFVVDTQGFVIAHRGRIPAEGFEGAGAELVCSIEQLQRIAPDAGEVCCIDIEFDRRRIVGFVAAAATGAPPYVIGIVAQEPLTAELKRAVTRQLAYSLPELD